MTYASFRTERGASKLRDSVATLHPAHNFVVGVDRNFRFVVKLIDDKGNVRAFVGKLKPAQRRIKAFA